MRMSYQCSINTVWSRIHTGIITARAHWHAQHHAHRSATRWPRRSGPVISHLQVLEAASCNLPSDNESKNHPPSKSGTLSCRISSPDLTRVEASLCFSCLTQDGSFSPVDVQSLRELQMPCSIEPMAVKPRWPLHPAGRYTPLAMTACTAPGSPPSSSTRRREAKRL